MRTSAPRPITQGTLTAGPNYTHHVRPGELHHHRPGDHRHRDHRHQDLRRHHQLECDPDRQRRRPRRHRHRAFTQTFDTKNVGTAKTLTPAGSVTDGNGGANYTVTFVNDTTGVITARAITVTATTDTKTYDATTSSSGDADRHRRQASPAPTPAAFTQTFDTKNVGTAKTLTPAGSVTDGNGGANYAITFVNDTTGVITARAITVTAATDTKTYDAHHELGGDPDHHGGHAWPAPTPAAFTQTFDTANVGTGKTLTPAGSVTDGNGGANYAITFVNDTTGVITPVGRHRDRRLRPDQDLRRNADPTLTYTVTSGLTAERRHASPAQLSRTAGENVGTTAITHGHRSTATVAPTTPSPSSPATLSPSPPGPSPSPRPPTPRPTTPPPLRRRMPDRHRRHARRHRHRQLHPDLRHQERRHRQDADPRRLGQRRQRRQQLRHHLRQRHHRRHHRPAITVTATTDTKTYDAHHELGGDPDGDHRRPRRHRHRHTSPRPSTPRTSAPARPSPPPARVNDGNGGDNYAITFVNDTTGVITARAITVTATTDTKTYDGTTSSAAIPTITAGTLAGTDTGAFTQTFDTANVGTGKTLTPAGSVTDGNGGANYAITFVNDTTGVISQWAVTVTADSGQTKIYGNADPTLTYTVTSGSLQNGDTFSGALARTAGENVGTTDHHPGHAHRGPELHDHLRPGELHHHRPGHHRHRDHRHQDLRRHDQLRRRPRP